MKGIARFNAPNRSGVPLGQKTPLTTYHLAQGENILPDPPCTSTSGSPIASTKGVKSTSLWLDTAHPARQPTLTQDTEADVCVIGAGIAGVTTA